MYQEKITLCGSSAYTQKYYFNDNFDRLPQPVKDELKIMCVMYTEEVGGVLTLEFDEEGTLLFSVTRDEGDILFDEIGSGLIIKKLQNTKKELLEALEMYYKVFFFENQTISNN